MAALTKFGEHYPIKLTESMISDYWHALKYFDKDRLRSGFRKLMDTWDDGFFPKPAQLRKWMVTYMSDNAAPVKALPEPVLTEDMRKFNRFTAHYYISVVFGSIPVDESKDVREWMKTKEPKCKSKGCEVCAETHDPDWVDNQYRIINEGGTR